MLPGELWFYFGVAWLITLRVPSPSFLLIPDPVSLKGGGWQVNSCNSPKEATESPKTEKQRVEACLICFKVKVGMHGIAVYHQWPIARWGYTLPSWCMKGELTTFGTVVHMNT